MSGFDFDALRDPSAPPPGDRERVGVAARARRLRSRSRLRRFAVASTSIAAVVAITVGVLATNQHNGPEIAVPGASTSVASTPNTVGPSIDDRFIPATSVENGQVVLPVTLPDGESFTLRYPAKLRIAQLGFAGSVTVSGTRLSIDYTNIQRVYGDAEPIAVYHGANGERVPFFHAPQSPSGGPRNSEVDLAFQFGPWLVRAATASATTDAERATLARSLTGSVDANGYLLLGAESPLSIGSGFDGGFNAIDAGNFVRLTSHSSNRRGQLTCGPGQSDGPSHRRRTLEANGWSGYSWCAGNDLHVAVGGSSTFTQLANDELRISPLASPTIVPNATTTSPPTVPVTSNSSAALSASFVSAKQGWMLEKNGTVGETTDGGATWNKVGSLDGMKTDTRIRFADSAHGFAFSYAASGAAPVWSTDDGGTTWKRLDIPFSGVFDLAISRGVVYAVSFQQRDTTFRIWSSPSDRLAWIEDPLAIRPGAGPVPTIQLVFSGTSGWLVEVDRVVTAGARMSTTGHWSTWTPPCKTINGLALLAASTSRDLVASCDEGVWGPPARATSVYFSHDGGATFRRRPAPTYGLVASPNPTTAVVLYGGQLQRTTDEGATWKATDAHRGKTFAPLDFGFTTSTQGFAILGDGPMLMTDDAGATWSRVTQP